jgi:lipopolysaccharide/colanic/teichoic acid biosynthesis glycosyltransferase
MRGSRALDVALSLALLPVAALAALPLALAVFLDSPGTVLFRSPRLGCEGRPFAMLKFRTMRTGPARLRGGGAAARHVADREGAYLEHPQGRRALAPRVASPAVGLGKQRTCR